jgi:hypothetical protein
MADKTSENRQVTIMKLKTASGEVIERSLRINAIPFGERAAVRKATGMPFEAFLGDEDGVRVGLDTIQVWWWLAMRADNPLATLDQALGEWPDEIEENTFDVVMDDGEDDSPEA